MVPRRLNKWLNIFLAALATGERLYRHVTVGPMPSASGFERTTEGRLLELTVVIFYGDEIRTGLKGYWFWHPGRQQILYHEVAPSGRVRMGTSHFTDSTTFITLTESVGSDGKTTPNRGVNVLHGENEHRTTAYALGEQGNWVEQQSLVWVREPESTEK